MNNPSDDPVQPLRLAWKGYGSLAAWKEFKGLLCTASLTENGDSETHTRNEKHIAAGHKCLRCGAGTEWIA